MKCRFLVLSLFGWSCTAADVALFVDVRSDFRPGIDVHEIVSRLVVGDGHERREETTLGPAQDLRTGVRVASFLSLAPGPYTLHIDALDMNGLVVASRRGEVELTGTTNVTIVFSRACDDTLCPGPGDFENATECVSGVCVAPECFPESPEMCGGTCDSNDDCLDIGCGVGTCLDSLCLNLPDNARCPNGGTCAGDLVCVGGAMDAGNDAGPPPFDAGPPPPSCPSRAQDCQTPFVSYARIGGWSCRADAQLGRALHRVTCRVCNGGGCTDCDYDSVVVECRCREAGGTYECSGGRCENGVSFESSRCDEDDSEFGCDNITDIECDY